MIGILMNLSRTFGVRFKEHLKALSPIFDNCNTSGHTTTIESLKHSREGGPEPSMYIRVNNPYLNKKIGKYHLPQIWNEAQFITSELKLKYHHSL